MRFGQGPRVAAHTECLLRGVRHGRKHRAKVERPAVRYAGLDARLERRGKRRIERAQTLTHYGDVATIDVGTPLQHVDDRADNLSPLRSNRQLKGGLSLTGAVEGQCCQSSPHKGIGPRVQLFLAGVEAGQKDGNRRPRRARGPAQIAHHGRALEWNGDALDRRIGTGGAGLVARQHAPMRGEILVWIVRKEMLRVVKVDRGAQIGFRRRHLAAALGRFDREFRVTRAFLAPDAAPIVPALDALRQSLEIVGIDAGRDVTRRHVHKDKIDLRITRHAPSPDAPQPSPLPARAETERTEVAAVVRGPVASDSRNPARSSRGSTSWMKYGMAAR